ncbi:hypothetical protein B005_3715 [Nocardiopsis alba ATCC BAA-2165]|uniref:Uncharacterized protein n=1 Tax=Nocardiopsis alba (strain ATCC BAA-2165 / BE74) TaxID=1205910 RepID=J7LEK2_NOCAA|nr:hypothetical protein B005_3715 [Nocardiopsis alba ATCC BAA-2165]
MMPCTGQGFALVLGGRGYAGYRGGGGSPYTPSCGRYTLHRGIGVRSADVGVCRKREPGVSPGLPRSGEWERKSSKALVLRPDGSNPGSDGR